MIRLRLLCEEDQPQYNWIATYSFGMDELDDLFTESSIEEVKLEATDFDTAVKYAQQYIRKMQLDETQSEKWSSAELISVELDIVDQ